MKRLSIVSLSLLVLVGSAADSETFRGTAARSGMYKRPQLLVDGKRYELRASDKANPSVAKTPARFSKGETGTYEVIGTQATVNAVLVVVRRSIT